MKEINSDKRTQEIMDEINRKTEEVFNNPEIFAVREPEVGYFPVETKYTSVIVDKNDT